MIFYNMATWFCTMIVVLMVLFIAIAFQALPGQQGGNLPGKDFEGRISDGLKASPGIRATEFK